MGTALSVRLTYVVLVRILGTETSYVRPVTRIMIRALVMTVSVMSAAKQIERSVDAMSSVVMGVMKILNMI